MEGCVKISPPFPPLFLLIVSVFPATHVTALCSIGLMVTINPRVKPDVSRLNAKGRIPVKIYKPPELGACKHDRCPDDLVVLLVSNLFRDRARNNDGMSLRVSER